MEPRIIDIAPILEASKLTGFGTPTDLICLLKLLPVIDPVKDFADKLAAKIDGSCDYHGKDLLAAIREMAEGKDVESIKPVEDYGSITKPCANGCVHSQKFSEMIRAVRYTTTRLCEYDKIDISMKMLTGHYLEEMLDLFKAGWTLKAPDVPTSISEIVKYLGGEDDGA